MERAQSASVESIPEVLEDRDLLADQSDSASVHDMDYVNPRGVRFTQSTQKEGKRNRVSRIYVKGSDVKMTSHQFVPLCFSRCCSNPIRSPVPERALPVPHLSHQPT